MLTKLLAAVTIATVVGIASAASTVQSPDVDAGRQVFQANCAMCHGNDATGMMGMHPALRGAVERLTREGVEVTVRNGRDTNPPMPAFEGRLTDQQIDEVITYISSLPPGPRNFGRDAGGMMDGMMSGGMWWMAVVLVAALAIIATVLVVVLRRASGRHGSRGETAREVLDRRYAAGEISHEEYVERRSDLES